MKNDDPLAELDALFKTPLGKKPRRKKKKRKKARQQINLVGDDELSAFRLRAIERAATRASQWRLTATAYEVRIFIQHVRCTNCSHKFSAPVSAPMVAYRDRIGRVRCEYADNILPTDVPIVTSDISSVVPICPECIQAQVRGDSHTQLHFNFLDGHQLKRALVPLSETPQAVWEKLCPSWDNILEPLGDN